MKVKRDYSYWVSLGFLFFCGGLLGYISFFVICNPTCPHRELMNPSIANIAHEQCFLVTLATGIFFGVMAFIFFILAGSLVFTGKLTVDIFKWEYVRKFWHWYGELGALGRSLVMLLLIAVCIGLSIPGNWYLQILGLVYAVFVAGTGICYCLRK